MSERGRRELPAAKENEDEAAAGENKAAAVAVRAFDRDRYWSAAFAPRCRRPALLGLYAFNVELARVPRRASEPMAGQIRLQWWRDAIGLCHREKTGNPLADALIRAIHEHDLPKDVLIGMVDARADELLGDVPANRQALEMHLQRTSGAVFAMAAAVLGDRSGGARNAAAYAGVTYGIIQLLREPPMEGPMPRHSLLSNYLHRTIDGAFSRADALFDLRQAATDALIHFRELAPAVNNAAWPAFLSLAVARAHLREGAADGRCLPISPIRRFWLIWRAAAKGAL